MVNWDEGGKPDDNLNLIQQLGKWKVSSKMTKCVPSAELTYSKANMQGLQQVLTQVVGSVCERYVQLYA